MASIIELKGYLGYGLKCHMSGEYVEGDGCDNSTPIVATLTGIDKDYSSVTVTLHDDENEDYVHHIDDVFPHLHPLSDLTKPCLEGGKVPIHELLREFHFCANDIEVFGVDNTPNGVIEKLYEWHFWLGDQSRFKEDIVDINTLMV